VNQTKKTIIDPPNRYDHRDAWTATVITEEGNKTYSHHRLSQLMKTVRATEGNITVYHRDGTRFDI